ncbi:phage tail length tape measure family protein [Klebsiella variicola]|uniref:phage tail length tape measure family protein n=1 Tax=Klebsiella variicola TaxID=244366 RepID=UPI000E2A9A40|nr:phage tail length tape measure family protein [Klebsiella variicola]SXG98040.1 Prophage tail length tape measure [Klebsiella variicola]
MTEQTSRLAIILDSTGAEKNADSLASALNKMTAEGEKAEFATDNLSAATKDLNSNLKVGPKHAIENAKSTRSQREEIEKLLDKLDPTSKAFDELDKAMERLKKANLSGVLGAEEFTHYSSIIDQTRNRLQSAQDELTGYTQAQREAAKAAQDSAAQQAQQERILTQLQARLDPVTHALQALDEQQRQIFEYTYSGALSIQQYDAYSAKIAEARRELNGEAQAEREAVKAQEEQRASLQRLVGQLDPFSAALEKIKKQRAELSAAKDAGLLTPEYHAELSNKLDLTEKGLNQVSNEMRFGAISAGQYKNAMRLLPAQLNDIAVGLAGGMPLFTIFMQQGSQIADSFGGWGNLFEIIKQQLLGAGDAAYESSDSLSDNANSLSENAENAKKLTGFLNPMTIGIGALIAVVGTLAYAWYKGSQEQQEYNKTLIMTGNIAGVTAGKLADMASRVASETGNPIGDVAAILNDVVSSGKIAADSIEMVTHAIVSMTDASDIAAGTLVSDFEKIAANPVSAVTELNEKYNFLTLDIYRQIQALQEQGKTQDAAALATQEYSKMLEERSAKLADNLGLFESAWKTLGDAAKGAWDAMLNIGREATLEQRLEEAQKLVNTAASGYTRDVWGNVTGLRGEAQADVNILTGVINLQDDLNQARAKGQIIQNEGIKAMAFINQQSEQALSNAQKRTKEQDKLTQALIKARAAGTSISAEEEARLRANINEKYKDPKSPKGKAYTEDAATRLINQLNQQYATLQSQYDTTEKIGTAQQSLIKWEQQLADIKTKKTLTADQKSLLANQRTITAQYEKNAAFEKEIALRKDADKLTAYKNTLSSGLQNDATGLQNSLNSNTVLSREQKRQRELAKIVSDYQKKQVELTNQRTTGQISQHLYDQETAALQQALNQRLAMQHAYYTQMEQLNSNWQLGVQNGMQSYLNSVPTLYESVTAATTSIFSSTESAISSDLSAMLQGTESLSDGFKNMAVGMGQAVIDALAKMAAQWLVYQAVQLLVGKTVAAGAAASMVGQATAMSQIAGINAYASAAAIPVTGWAMAPAAMAAALAATTPLIASVAVSSAAMTAGGGLTGMAHNGIDSIPSTGTWLLEKGERVMTADTSAKLDSTLENLRKNGLDATLSKPGFGTGVQNVNSDNSSKTTIHAPIEQHFHTPPGVTPDQMALSMAQTQKRATTEALDQVAAQLLRGDGKVGKAMRSKYTGRGLE